MHQRIYKHRQIQDSRDVKINKGEFQFIRKNNFTKVFKVENIHLRLVQSTTLSITCQIGADLCTNLVILSPHLITLHDPQLIKVEDCYNTYHYPRQLVNKKSRADHLIQMCHKLNNKVYVDKTATEITEEGCLKYDVVIFCDVWDLGRVICIDKFIRSQKQSKTVVLYGAQMGFFGLAINDFGEQWEMYHSGQDFPKVNITKITSAQRGKVTTATPHNYQTGDFVTIHYVEGMKYVNSDARPVTVVDQTNFLIEDTRNFGQYIKGGVSQKVDLVQKLKFPSFEQQLSRRHSELMLIAKAIICFYQNNSRLPGLFDEANEEETMQNLKVLSQKSGMKYDENYARKVIKTCDYSFYPLINMFASILSLEVVKCTGKYKPIKTPFFVDWYNIINFQTKKKLPDQMINIIDTSTLQKLASLQIGIVDDGSQSMQLLNLLYSCSIGEKNRVILCGLQSINETNEPDGLLLKAKLKYQVSNQLFKNKKTQTMPCSLSFSHDLILSDMWKKIKLLINTSSKLNQYVYNNVIWNQIDIVDSSISDLEAILKMCASGKSQLKQRQENSLTSSIIGSNSGQSLKLIDYRACVQLSLEQFRLIFIEIFEDVRCFFNVGGSYIDRVKMLEKRRNIFLFIICCLEDGSHMQPENIVKIAKYIFEQLFCGKLAIDQKDPLVMDYLKSLYYMIAWFFTKKQPKVEQVNNQFILHLNKPYEDGSLSQKQKFDIAFTKLAMGNQLTIPYLSLNDLFKKEHTVKLIWNGSQLHAKINSLDEEINSKKFYKYYFRKLRPCPFISQIINSLIPITVLQNCYGNLKNCEIDMIEGKIQMVNCPPPIPLKHQKNTRLVPENANEWTILIVQGPKKITQIIERFNYVQNIVVTKIRCQNETLYDKEKKNLYMDFTIESIPAIIEKQKKDAYELHVQAVDREGNKCEVSRVKYTVC